MTTISTLAQRYQLVAYMGQFAPDFDMEPGIDIRINYDNPKTAEMAAAIACAIDFHDAALVYDRETGEVVCEVGHFPTHLCDVYE